MRVSNCLPSAWEQLLLWEQFSCLHMSPSRADFIFIIFSRPREQERLGGFHNSRPNRPCYLLHIIISICTVVYSEVVFNQLICLVFRKMNLTSTHAMSLVHFSYCSRHGTPYRISNRFHSEFLLSVYSSILHKCRCKFRKGILVFFHEILVSSEKF